MAAILVNRLEKGKDLCVLPFRSPRRHSPGRRDEPGPLQLHALHQQSRFEGADLHVAREHCDDVGWLVLCRKADENIARSNTECRGAPYSDSPKF